jgi:hypothetical protein
MYREDMGPVVAIFMTVMNLGFKKGTYLGLELL